MPIANIYRLKVRFYPHGLLKLLYAVLKCHYFVIFIPRVLLSGGLIWDVLWR